MIEKIYQWETGWLSIIKMDSLVGLPSGIGQKKKWIQHLFFPSDSGKKFKETGKFVFNNAQLHAIEFLP